MRVLTTSTQGMSKYATVASLNSTNTHINSVETDVIELQTRPGWVNYIHGNTYYQTDVIIPTITNSIGVTQEITTSDELGAHAAHDATMFADLTAQILAANFTEEQIQDIVNKAIETAGDDAATKTWVNEQGYLKTAQLLVDSVPTSGSNNLISSGGVYNSVNTINTSIAGINTVLEDTNTVQIVNVADADCSLDFCKYANGDMIIRGWIKNAGSAKQVMYPDGYSFVDPSVCGAGCLYTDIADQSNAVLHGGKIQISGTSLIFKASSFGVAILGGGAVDDNDKYNIYVTGRWTE